MTQFTIDLKDGTATVELSGKLDTTNAPELVEELKTLAGKDVSKVAFMAKGLEYISSAGLRAIVFAKQKIGQNLEVFVVGATAEIIEVIKMTGFDSFVTITNTL